jgi:excisionase family DNA binding protein
MGLPDPRDRPLLSVAETAAILGEGEKSIYRAAESSDLPSLRIGRYVRIPTAALWELCGIPLSTCERSGTDNPTVATNSDPATGGLRVIQGNAISPG